MTIDPISVLSRSASKSSWTIGVVAMGVYAFVFAWFSPLLLQDYPNHLARAVVIDDLVFHGGGHFGRFFEYQSLAIPYILSDLPLVALVELFGPTFGGALWSVLILLALPCALLFYMRSAGMPRQGQVFAFILSMYLATGWFYMMGFLAFALAIAAILFCYAFVELLRRRWSTALFITYMTMVVLAYLVHLTTLIFLIAAVTVSAGTRLWFRTTSARKEVLILLPLAALLAWHFGVGVRFVRAGDLTEESYSWGTVLGKFARVGWQFIRYNELLDALLLLDFVACISLMVRHNVSRIALAQPRVLEMLALAATFLMVYIVLPEGYPGAWYVDVRALPLVTLFLLFACLSLPGDAHGVRTSGALPLAVLLIAGNLFYLGVHLSRGNAWLTQYRAVIAALPRGAQVLPIYTGREEGTLRPSLNAAAFVVTDRDGVIPYLFSGDRGSPMKYFRYVERRYYPYQRWYEQAGADHVNWRAVSCSYDFLLAMKPFSRERILVSTRTVMENGSAALLAVTRQTCPNRLDPNTGMDDTQ